MSVTNLLVPTFTQMLRAQSAWLDKAQRQRSAAEAEALLSKRLAPDMFPLSSQIRFSCFQALEPVFRLRGEPVPESLVQVRQEALNAGERHGSMKDAQARVAEALSLLHSLDSDALDAGAERPIKLELPNGVIFEMTGAQYARDWALAQFYFHLTTAYAILRNQGIELGKADYVAHMSAYFRPARVPQG